MKKAMIYGAGISGKSVQRLLEKEKWETVLVDDKNGISSTDAVSYLEDIDLFIKSPGIPYNELVKKAQSKGLKITDEVEVAYNYMRKTSPTKVIAITGTNGKTTTTSKVAELLNLAGFKATPAGNIGIPYSSAVLEEEKYDYIILELSSYQLENLYNFKADIAMIINLAPDHLNRYDSVEDYYEAKLNVTMNQTNQDKFILNIDDKEIMKRISKINSEKINISLKEVADTYSLENNLFYKEELISRIDKFSLKGKHNLQNILFLVSVAKIVGIENKIVIDFLKSTKNLEHRMEDFFVEEERNLKFINDSKGTNLESTLKAIMSFDKPILICGGCDKKLDLKPLIDGIKKNVSKIYLIGELAPLLEKKLLENKYNKENIYNLGTLEEVILNIKRQKVSNTTILLSPSTSSFDQFKSFEDRGRIFKKLVLENFSK